MTLSQNSTKKGVEYWLIWKFEGEATLADLLQSKEFPYNVGTFLNQNTENVKKKFMRLRHKSLQVLSAGLNLWN